MVRFCECSIQHTKNVFMCKSTLSDVSKDLLTLKQQQDLLKEAASSSESTASNKSQISPGLIMPPGMTTPPLPHFVCEGCGIKFKSVSNLQAHQARYCAGLRKASEDAFEALLLKQKQHHQIQQQQKVAAVPMLEMMSLLNAKSTMEHGDKLGSLMMSSMAAAAMAAANANTPLQSLSNGSSNASEDYCCILCGYKEQSVERLKDHINLHFIGQVKRKHEEVGESESKPNSAKKAKVKEEQREAKSSEDVSVRSPVSGTGHEEDQQLKCNSCDIGFSHLSNFVAHKKYYCRDIKAAITSTSPKSERDSSSK